jgi:hypothetical protein
MALDLPRHKRARPRCWLRRYSGLSRVLKPRVSISERDLSTRRNRKTASAEQKTFIFHFPSLLTAHSLNSPASVPFSLPPISSFTTAAHRAPLLELFAPASQLQFGPSDTDAGRRPAACCQWASWRPSSAPDPRSPPGQAGSPERAGSPRQRDCSRQLVQY